MNVSWSTVAHEFTRDGSLRDIYVSPVTLDDWQRVFEFVRSLGTAANYWVNGDPAVWPASIIDAFATRAHASPALIFRVSGIHLVAHFFDEATVEMDFLPQDVSNQAELDLLLSFLQHLGDLLAKPVSVTPEGCMDEAFLVYQPSSREFLCTPAPTSRYV